MNVKDLIQILEKYDPEIEVLGYSEDQELLTGKQGFKLFEILDVTANDAEKCRDEKGKPSLKFTTSEKSQKHVLMEITTDF